MSSLASSLAPAFDFVTAEKPAVLVAAEELVSHLSRGDPIARRELNKALSAVFGGSDAEGRWGASDAHAALELAQVLWLHEHSGLSTVSSPVRAASVFDDLDGLLLPQHNRSEEQIALQQFSTPPRLAWLAARAACLKAGELMLEPSAGTGMLAVWAAITGNRLALNEISPLRRSCLAELFPTASITAHDGELIDELLGSTVSPAVVLMNPPYSHGVERGADGRTGARHLRSAWRRLAAGGRLVAIMPEWFDLGDFVRRATGPLTLRLDVEIEQAFARHGTSITTRLIVLDKVSDEHTSIIVRTSDFAEICAAVDRLPLRSAAMARIAEVRKPPLQPLLLVSKTPLRRPAPPVRSSSSAMAVVLAYETLEVPAPIAEQVGHYLPYRPSRIRIPAATDHPTPLVESVAMGSITAPVPNAVPQVASGLIEKGVLSAAQAETLIYAANAHDRDLPGTYAPIDKGCALEPSAEGQAYRMGYFLGDGTGAGKGRQVASVILDRWLRGERRHIWISKNEALLEDARRDWCSLGGLPLDIQPLSQWKLGLPVTMAGGILFVTYPTLRSGRADATRMEQLLAWAGETFDGVIVFDEAHAMANAAGGEGSRGKVKGSEQGIAGVRLQNLLPRARVLYASATGASDVNNLAYATRLGLWGPETAFATRETFVADIREGGIAAMELVARDLKALGLYTARALSFAGVEYEILEHCLSAEQIAVYDAYAGAWAIIHANLREALEATRIVDVDSGDTLNKGAKSAAISVFEGTKQRFFAQLLLSMKLPSLDAARQAGTLDLGVETIAVESFEVISDTLLRTDAVSGATTHLLELEIARSLKPLSLVRLFELYGQDNPCQRMLSNGRSGRVGLLIPARRLLSDEGERIERFELIRPLKRVYLTAEQLDESSWSPVDEIAFRRTWAAEVAEAGASLKRERVHIATGLLLPIWDKLPAEHVRVSRIAAKDGRSMLGREVPGIFVPDLFKALGLDNVPVFAPEDIVQMVMAAGKPMEFRGLEQLAVKRSLVGGSQRLELTGWSPARLDWYKTKGCFTEIIRYQTRLFIPVGEASQTLAQIC